MSELPDRAQVVVIGGGVIGSSIAYHLAHLGWTDVLVLERDRLTSGTTWHAAGLVTTFGSLSHTATQIRLYGRELYARLPAETGQATGFTAVGLVEAAADAERLHEYRRVAAFQRAQGLEVHEVGPREMAELFPPAVVADLAGGFWVPGDGRVNPVDLTMALAKGAKQLGVRVVERVRVESVLTRGGRVPHVTGVAVTRDAGRGPHDRHGEHHGHGESGEQQVIACDVVVNAAGMWARELAARNDVLVPNQAAEHYYLVTEPIDGIHPGLPVFEDPAAHGYYREEGGGLLVGLFEPHAAAWAVPGIPAGSSFVRLPADWARIEPFLQIAMARVPVTLGAGIRTLFCGPESFTPDLRPAVGEAPGLRGYFVCAGLNSIGILSSGGLGRLVARWIVAGDPGADVTAMDVARFQPHQLTPRHRVERTVEILGTVYASHTPGGQLASIRGVRRGPLHDRQVALGACFTEVAGWETPEWYAGVGRHPVATPSWAAEPGAEWFECWRVEHEAMRVGVGLVDRSARPTLLVEGPAAAAVLDRVSTADVAGAAGRMVESLWLDDRGRIKAIVAITGLRADAFLVVADDPTHGQALAWLRKSAGEADCAITEVTAAYATLSLLGPRAGQLLQAVTSADLTLARFAEGAARWIDLGAAPVLAVRRAQGGAPGWQVIVPAEYAGHVHETLVGAGAPLGLRHCGRKALDGLRLESGRPAYGRDVGNTDDVGSAGLSELVCWDKPGQWLGRAAAVERRAAGPPTERLVSVRLSEPRQQVAQLLHHGEIVLRDGVPVGDVRSGSFGFTVGAPLGLAMVSTLEAGGGPVSPAWLGSGRWQLDIAGQRHPAVVTLGGWLRSGADQG